MEALGSFEKCVDKLLTAESIELHGDSYFNLLDVWIDRLPLGSMAPRDKSLIVQSLKEAMAHPAFDILREKDDFQKILHRLIEEGGRKC